MSTNANICMKTKEGYKSIYCHWDGYPDHVGKILLNHYQDPAKIEALLNLGDISSLGERVDPIGPHSFQNPEDGTTVAYHRDRSEPLNSPQPCRVLAFSISEGLPYTYLFEDGEWYVFEGKVSNPKTLLKDLLNHHS